MQKIIAVIFIFLSTYCFGQLNLVPNPSFEDTIHCPTGFYDCKNWFNPTDNSPDFFHQCSPPNILGVSKNFIGYQNAHTGIAYAGGGGIYNTQNGREYIEVRLLDSLKSNKRYYVEFYVSLADSSQIAIDKIGAYISKDSVYDHNSFLFTLPYQPQIENPAGNVITDTLNWIKVSGMYDAQGGEKFITIGNFYPDSLTAIDTVSGPWYEAYYYIDDVSVIDTGFTGINEVHDDVFVNVYPNPTNGVINISCSTNAKEVFITDVIGQRILSVEKRNANRVDISSFPIGIYFLNVRTEKGILVRKILKE